MKLFKDNRGIAHLAVFIAVAVIAIGAVGWVSWNSYQARKNAVATQQVNQATDQNDKKTEQADPYAGWRTYYNEAFKFQLKYPDGRKIVVGSTSGSTDVHFLDDSNKGIAVIVEPTSGYCYKKLCDIPMENQRTFDGNTWDYLGKQTGSGYDLPVGAEPVATYFYRSVQGKFRYYVSFDHLDDSSDLVMGSFKVQ